MQLRVSTLCKHFSLVLCFLLACHTAFSEPVSQNTLAPVYKVIDDSPKLSTYPSWLYNFMRDQKGWAPLVTLSQECELSFSSKILNPDLCRAHYKLNPWNSFLSKIYVRFNFEQDIRFHRVQFEPQNGVKFRGLLGLQSTREKRPLVILRMGIHGNVDEFLAERFLAKIIFEDLGYNILVLESLTSHGYLTINDRISEGGIEEGLHTFYVLQLLRQNKIEWSKQISDIYLMGLSLAGPGVFIANYLDEQVKYNGKHKKQIKSIELFCPLVNFEQTFNQHALAGRFQTFMDFWNYRRFAAIRLKHPELGQIQWWKSLFDFKPRFMPAVLAWLNTAEPKPILKLETFKKQFPDLELPREFVKHIEKSQSFYELQNFWPLYKNEKTPISIYTTPHDPAVMNYLNSNLIRDKKQPGKFTKVEFTELEGLHCALAPEYQWPFLVELTKRGFERK